MTKLRQLKIKNNNIPAGIIEGTEAFWFDDEKWLMQDGVKIKFVDAPIKLQDMIANQFLCDETSKNYLRKIGITAFSKAFDMWFRCVLGAFDSIPDFLNGKFTADNYNYSCNDNNCIHRGKFCGRASGLNNIDSQTLIALKQGENFKKTAAMLFVSEPGLKSRVTKLRQKLEAKNTAALTARAAEIGI